MTKNTRFSPEVRQRAVRMVLESQDGSFAAFWLHNNKGRLTRGCNPAYSKSIHTWLRFGEIMRGSLSATPHLLPWFAR